MLPKFKKMKMTDELQFQRVALRFAGFKTEGDVINSYAEYLEGR